MLKNRKGFTLVELLGAVTILGILIVLSAPVIIHMVSNSRDKIYVNDAKRLIATAEYKIKASSSVIEKPDPGDCIAISLVYLDNGEFDSPPNKGEYIKEASFVVIKNDNGTMKYSTALVEKTKTGSFRGVELTTEEELESAGLKHVVNFKTGDVVYIGSSDFNIGYINNSILSGYVNNISALYIYPDLGEFVTNLDVSGPIVRLVDLSSVTELKGDVDAKLKLRVDDDKPRNQLKIYSSFTSFSDAETKTPVDYGNNDVYEQYYDFSDHGYTGETITLYLVIKDADNNKTMQKVEYILHKNEVPVIETDASKLEKRDIDDVNMPNAKFVLRIKDDIDNVDSPGLQVCLTEDMSKTKENCGNYKAYSSLFTDNIMEYKFGSCGEMCNRTTSTQTKKVRVFVKDSSGAYSDPADFTYVISANQVPTINSISINSDEKSFLPEDGSFKDKTAFIKVNVSDDMKSEDYQISITENGVETKEQYTNNDIFNYTFSGKYDGNTRNVSIKIIDSEGGVSTASTQTYGPIYNNIAPKINGLSLLTVENACNDISYCGDVKPDSSEDDEDDAGDDVDEDEPEEEEEIPPSNSNVVSINLDAEDDIEVDNDYEKLLVCVSTNTSDCSCSDYNSCKSKKIGDKEVYTSYKEFIEDTQTYTFNGSDVYYTDATRTLYAYIIDTDGLKANKSVSYTIYRNRPPVIVEGPSLGTIDSSKELNLSNMRFYLRARDDMDLVLADTNADDEEDTGEEEEEDPAHYDGDFYVDLLDDNKNHLKIKYCYKNKTSTTPVCSNEEKFVQVKNFDRSWFDSARGIIDIYAVISDQYGGVVQTEPIEYDSSNETDFAPEIVALKGVRNGTNVDISFIITDPEDTYSLCVSSSDESCSNYSTTVYNGNNTGIQNLQYDNSANKIVLYLFAKDSNEKVSTQDFIIRDPRTCPTNSYYEVANDLEYSIYSYDYEYLGTNPDDTQITPTNCNSKCYREDADGGVNENVLGTYNRLTTYRDKFKAETSCNDVVLNEEITADCSFRDCFRHNGTGSYVKYAIGTKVYTNSEELTVKIGRRTYSSNKYYKLYSVTYIPGSESITLTEEISTKMIKPAVDAGEYKYTVGNDDSYVRIDDRETTDEITINATFGKVYYLDSSETIIGQEDFNVNNDYTIPDGTETIKQEVNVAFKLNTPYNYKICVSSNSYCKTFTGDYVGNTDYQYTYQHTYSSIDEFLLPENNNKPGDLDLNMFTNDNENILKTPFLVQREVDEG